MPKRSRVVLITGLQAAGKSTVGPLLAQRLGPPAASFDGDHLHRMVVSGRDPMTPNPSPEALRQVGLRYQGSALLAQHYADHGFDFVCNDIILGTFVAGWMDSIARADRHLIVLTPSVDAIVERELERGGANSYRDWHGDGDTLADGVRSMATALDETPRRGLWIDTSDESAERTVERILDGDMRASRYQAGPAPRT